MRRLHIIWDLDGTLIDSEKDVFDSLKDAINDAGLSGKSIDGKFRLGPTIDTILDNSFSSNVLTNEKKKEIIAGFRNRYDNCGFSFTAPFSGIEDLLKDSNHFIHHIITNKPDLPVKRILLKLKWDQYFSTVRTPYTNQKHYVDKKKQLKSELFAECYNEFSGFEFISVGDMAADCEAAIKNDIPSVGVLWGTGTDTELKAAGCNKIVSSVDELNEFLIKMAEDGLRFNSERSDIL